MYCTSCGKRINDDSSFCQYCGAPQNSQPSSYMPNNQQQPYQQQQYQQQPRRQLTETQQYLKDLREAEPKTYSKVFCVLGFIVSIINIFIISLTNLSWYIPINIVFYLPLIGLIFSIPGLVSCNKNGMSYRILAIISIIINGYLILIYLPFYL